MAPRALRDANFVTTLIAANTTLSAPVTVTGVALTDSTPIHVAIVDSNGDQITSFGGGTQYTDGGTPPLHPVGNTIEWNNAGTWATVGSANPLPVTATFSPSGTQDVNLTKVGGTSFALGQQLAAASIPIVLTAAQVTTLTPPAAITGFALETGGNLASIKTNTDKIPSLGKATEASSAPAVLPSTQLSALTARFGNFELLKKTVTTIPQTTSGNATVAYDGDDTIYLLAPGGTNSQIYSYKISTQVLTALTNGTTIEATYSGAALLYVNGKLYFSKGGGFNGFDRINTDGTGYINLTASNQGINFGCAMVWDGADLIYLLNNTPGFEKYSIAGNSWTTLATPAAVTEGCALALVGTSKIYALQGGGTTGFAVYDITGNAWTSKTAVPATVYDGGSLAWNGGEYIYAFRGNGAKDFWRYKLVDNTWTIMDNLPVPASTGSGFFSRNDGTFLAYITEPSSITDFGAVNNLYIYDPAKLNVANGALPMAGRYNSSQPSVSNTQVSELQVSADGSLVTALDTTTEGAADGISNTIRISKDAFGFTPNQKTMGWTFNGTTWDRMRSGAVANVAAATGLTDALLIGQYNATPPTLTDTRFNNLQLDVNGNLKTIATLQTQTDTVMVGGVNIKEINAVTPLMGNGITGTGSQRVTIASDNTVLPAVGAGATASAVPANASYMGLNASTALASAATAGNTTGVMGDKFGRQVVLLGSIRDLTGTQTTTISASTTETTIVTAGAAGIFNDLVMLIISNTSASTNTRIDFRDTTGGTILFSLESIGGGAPVGFALPIPIPQTSTATNWTAQCATSTTDIRVYAVFLKNK